MPGSLSLLATRLLEASTESLYLSLVGLSIPRRRSFHDASALYAAEIGLIGVAAELAMSACLVECYGPKTLLLGNNYYKSGAQILEDFRNLLRKDLAKANVIVAGIDNIADHIKKLLDYTTRFRVLISLRAAGLHAGVGTNYDVAVSGAYEVAGFLKQLSLSCELTTCLEHIPFPPNLAREKTVLLEDLINQIHETDDDKGRSSLIKSAFLVMPDIPEEKPEWLDLFNKITIAPEQNDIAFLLDVLEKAHPVSLTRQSSVGSVVPVRVVQSDNPNAIPISLTAMRREFTQLRDQWFADVANANARIKEGVLHLPPDEFVLKIFVNGLDTIQVVEEGCKIPAQQTWPFIISNLNVQGTARPYWFLIHRTEDLKELISFLEQAQRYARAYLKKQLPEIVQCIRYLIRNSLIPKDIKIYQEMSAAFTNASAKRSSIAQALNRHHGTKRAASEELERRIRQFINGGESLGNLLIDIVNQRIDLSFEARRYWANLLCESSTEVADSIGLFAVLKSPELRNINTIPRKSLLLIDFLTYGPPNDIRS